MPASLNFASSAGVSRAPKAFFVPSTTVEKMTGSSIAHARQRASWPTRSPKLLRNAPLPNTDGSRISPSR